MMAEQMWCMRGAVKMAALQREHTTRKKQVARMRWTWAYAMLNAGAALVGFHMPLGPLRRVFESLVMLRDGGGSPDAKSPMGKSRKQLRQLKGKLDDNKEALQAVQVRVEC
jgi:hypothetical protein